ncbi:hypothetical protein FRACYDRAFT_269806 [Fragilariopsis cylindrus CCMP1102]|uniref:Uncharacterized protein n=1 Tax=Fragilariopsis cylindrus CCMP1102 TaxID=635003 RepID=A0A1E7F5I0_9STRA|nr:hypothetical protein FRACYDRAFT_269806 [Fragilariopsis cylindrus CCMP1102]|eukprot:OEU13407.1 hypothetical protein FRACYDRAFT_269806 [Fragilariopsis cylindrus CCMP1102]
MSLIYRSVQAQVTRQCRSSSFVATGSKPTSTMFSSFYNQRSYSTTGVDETEVKDKTVITVNRSQIIEEIRTTYDLPKKTSERILATILDSIAEAVTDGKEVRLSSFGKFDSFMSKPTKGINPTTLGAIDIPSKQRFRFKAYPGFNKSSS